MKRAIFVLVLLAGCQSLTQAERYDRQGLRRRDQVKAIDDFTKAIDLEPGRADFWIHRGDARYRQGDMDGALADYTEALRLEASAVGHTRRARVRFKKRLDELALVDLGAALELDPNHAPAYRLRARVRADMGDAQGAKEDEQKAAELE